MPNEFQEPSETTIDFVRISLEHGGERWDLNPRPLEPQSSALPTELRPPLRSEKNWRQEKYREATASSPPLLTWSILSIFRCGETRGVYKEPLRSSMLRKVLPGLYSFWHLGANQARWGKGGPLVGVTAVVISATLCDYSRFYIGSHCALNGPAPCLKFLTLESHRAIAHMM